ncbi:MAG: helix-turn-helix transcriptional regulator [Candidatus Gastranaerophilales bacterium]
MRLTPKELEVIALVALGYSDKEIGTKLNISYGTIRTYIDRIVIKLDARNRTNAAAIFVRANMDFAI